MWKKPIEQEISAKENTDAQTIDKHRFRYIPVIINSGIYNTMSKYKSSEI